MLPHEPLTHCIQIVKLPKEIFNNNKHMQPKTPSQSTYIVDYRLIGIENCKLIMSIKR